MSGGTPLADKLGIRGGARVALLDAPDGAATLLAPLPAGVRLLTRAQAPLDVVVLFVSNRDRLVRRFPAAAAALTPTGGLWVAWPKRASRMPTDLSQSVVMEVGLTAGLVDNKVCAIDETWSALRFVRRLVDRPRR